jgi:acyl-CoA thioester hydrolase
MFRYRYRVTYADCTVGNHIYYGRYLELLEAARGEFFRHLGIPFLQWQERDTIFPVVECHLRYLAPARYDDTLLIAVRPAAVAGVRLSFTHQVQTEAEVGILEGETRHVCTTAAGKPKRLPAELVALLQPHVGEGCVEPET